MIIRKNVLWMVPVYSIIAGYIHFQVLIRLYTLTYLKNEDGSLRFDSEGMLMQNEVLADVFTLASFCVLLLAGAFFLRKMTRAEAALSATILLGIRLLLERPGEGLLPDSLRVYFSYAFQWCTTHAVFLDYEYSLHTFLYFATPYIFVLFGRRQIVQDS